MSAQLELFARLSPHMGKLDSYMRMQVEAFEPEIRGMAAYCLESTGKRLRPAMVFICGWRDDSVVSEELVQAAGVVEMVHLATLVHDDIMDRAEIRRNRDTATKRFGPDAAVLLGDALFSQALHIAAQFPTTEVCRLVSQSTRKVCSGEIMQTLRRREVDISLEDYYRMIDLKTAELFRTSCYLGASLSNHSTGFVQAADIFGHHLGIAYQIYDDLVDFLGEENHIGKSLGTDLATGKVTLPLMLLLQKVTAGERETLIAAIQSGRSLSLAESRTRMKELGVIPGVIAAIEEELFAATTALEPHTALSPVPLMRQLVQMLRVKVAALPVLTC